MSFRWRRNRRLKCECLGYWFPHRTGGGTCDHSKTRIYHLARRAGLSHEDARIEQALESAPVRSQECPF